MGQEVGQPEPVGEARVDVTVEDALVEEAAEHVLAAFVVLLDPDETDEPDDEVVASLVRSGSVELPPFAWLRSKVNAAAESC